MFVECRVTDDAKPKRKPQDHGAAPAFAPGKSGNPEGRKPGTKNKSTILREQIEEYNERKKSGPRMTPLDFFDMIIHDPSVSKSMRMRAAEAAAPYIHSKLPMRMPMDDPNDTFAKVRAALKAMAQSSNGQPATLAPAAPDAPKAEQK